ncbi:MAG: hypothetical protein JNL43_08530 [Flavobacteriales bacterium]|nr:hypothetical protein [Flavobacteriales bacterium]
METGASPAYHRSNVPWVRRLDALWFSHVWLALGASAQRWWLGEVGPSTDWAGIVGSAAAVIAGYGYLRIVRASEPDPIPTDHIRWVRGHRSAMMVLVGLSAASAAILFWGQHLVFGKWSWLVPALCVVYLLPLRNASGSSLGLREVPGIKVIVVALAWTFITCGITDREPWGYHMEMNAWMAVLQFGFFLAMAIAFDIGDLRYDRPGLRTVPQLLGSRGAKVLALLFLLPWVGFLLMMLLLSYHPIEPGWRKPGWDMGLLLPLMGIAIIGVVIARTDPQRPHWYFAVLLDGLLLLVPLLAWLGGRL